MQSEFLNIVLMPFDFFLSLLEENPFNFTEAFIILIFISAAFRYILAPILGYELGRLGSDYVQRRNKERRKGK